MKALLFLAIVTITAAAFGITACSPQKDSELADPPLITSATYQHTLYNGRGQAIDARAAKENVPLEIVYYTSEADYDADINGVTEAPSEVGLYYARIRRPQGNGYKQGRDIKVEYRIQKPLPPPEAANQ